MQTDDTSMSPADWLIARFDDGTAWREHERRISAERRATLTESYGPDYVRRYYGEESA